MCGTKRPVEPVASVIERHVVPADNSCLFTAVGYMIDDRHRMDRAALLRSDIASYISTHADKYNDAILGKPLSEYLTWITSRDHWGGAIECSVVSDKLGMEVAAIDIKTLRPVLFGEGSGYSRRMYLLYDGIHYDAVQQRGGDGAIRTVFDVGDEEVLAGAISLAGELQRTRQYTDMANFTLQCMSCSKGLTGESEARVHARDTGHTNFSEYTKPT